MSVPQAYDSGASYNNEASAVQYSILASVHTLEGPNFTDVGGIITPAGRVYVNANGSQTFSVRAVAVATPSSITYYKVQSVFIDQLPVPLSPDGKYTISNINADHTIDVNFIPQTHPMHNFSTDLSKVFTATGYKKTLIDQLAWKRQGGEMKRMIWDEKTRLPTSPAYTLSALHCNLDPNKTNPTCRAPTTNPNNGITSTTGWSYTTNLSSTTTYPSNITYDFTSGMAPTAGSNIVGITATSTDVKVNDVLQLIGDTIYLTVTVQNTNPLITTMNLDLPVNLGALMIGNFDRSTRKIWNCPLPPAPTTNPYPHYTIDPATNLCVDSITRQSTPEYGPGLSRLRPVKGGIVEPRYESVNLGIWDMYPNIGTFSPVVALWGEARFFDDVNGTYDSCATRDCGVTIGMQLLSKISLPDSISLKEAIGDQFSPKLMAKIHTVLTSNIPKTFTLAYKFADGYGNWQQALTPYKNWFNFQYGKINDSTKSYEAIPQYCPTAPFTYASGANMYKPDSSAYFNPTEHRYVPNTTMKALFKTDTMAPVMQKLGIRNFGIWKLALDSYNLLPSTDSDRANREYSPNITLIDPNLDLSKDLLSSPSGSTTLQTFVQSYSSRNLDVFAFARPCGYLEGANILNNLPPLLPTFIPGTWNGSVDLNNTLNRNRYFNDMKHYVDQGVKGFYLDNMGCPGDYEFVKYIKDQFKAQNNLDVQIYQEGAQDRNSLLVPAIPVQKLPVFETDNSALIPYLVPNATYYAGSFNNPLTDEELNYVLNKGFQAIPAPPLNGMTSWLCKTMAQSRANQEAKWQSYGRDMGCAEPPPNSVDCQNYPTKYLRVDIQTYLQGPVLTVPPVPSSVVGSVEYVQPDFTKLPATPYISNVLEGSHPTLVIRASPGFHILKIELKYNAATATVIPDNNKTYTYSSSEIIATNDPGVNPDHKNPAIWVTFASD